MLKIAKAGVPLPVTPPVQLLVHLYVQPSSPLPVQLSRRHAGMGLPTSEPHRTGRLLSTADGGTEGHGGRAHRTSRRSSPGRTGRARRSSNPRSRRSSRSSRSGRRRASDRWPGAARRSCSCNTLGLAVLKGLSDQEALPAFGEHYRRVLATPEGTTTTSATWWPTA
ncbi:HopJ type III effector protein [Streptomyces sp. NPDC041003]|uniref:HopJ type III effector protein n=1 Tax=Streptomyces sp. NPDC041003 TaxID=3155730 RepID=UPI0033FD4559